MRERTHEILQAGLNGALEHFAVDPDRLPAVADFVAGVIRDKYPDLKVPLHARWRHFVHGGEDLWARIASMRSWPDAAAKARSAFDLAIVSVLLDAGAGPAWRYRDAITGASAGRSEGLALASLRMFEAGVFSADPRDPLRADAARLMQLSESDLAAGFQASADNALDGLAGRADLLVRLGRVVAERADVFALADAARPGGLFDHLAAPGDPVAAPAILYALLLHLGAIWPARLTLDGVVLGDTWRHPAIRRADVTDGFVPFHKLSQWLAYSLIEPLRDAGLSVSDVDGLTGLAEYRNGGLFVDLGAIALRDPAQMQRAHAIDSTLVVEWRALTVALLDVLAPLVRTMLGVDAARFPLGCVLEGGTWAAGRKIAQALRTDGRPPFAVVSDGTVF
ncbi:MAG: hypothetical protein GHHEDOFH_00550 [Pseudorhodoplanes sp.]|nr:hypothetical protein [Pseudorhodoplanes sp.]